MGIRSLAAVRRSLPDDRALGDPFADAVRRGLDAVAAEREADLQRARDRQRERHEAELLAWERRQEQAGPAATGVAEWINENCLPDWAEGEECSLFPSYVADALEALGLRLVKT